MEVIWQTSCTQNIPSTWKTLRDLAKKPPPVFIIYWKCIRKGDWRFPLSMLMILLLRFVFTSFLITHFLVCVCNWLLMLPLLFDHECIVWNLNVEFVYKQRFFFFHLNLETEHKRTVFFYYFFVYAVSARKILCTLFLSICMWF